MANQHCYDIIRQTKTYTYRTQLCAIVYILGRRAAAPLLPDMTQPSASQKDRVPHLRIASTGSTSATALLVLDLIEHVAKDTSVRHV